jgi:hypothetical protein
MLICRGGIVDMTVAVNLITLAEANECYFIAQPVENVERAARVAGLLAAFSVVPTKRATQHGHLHQLFAALLVVVADHHDYQFKLATRDTTELSKSPLSSGVLTWLARSVEQGLLTHDQKTGLYTFTPTLKQACRELTDLEVVQA